MARRSAVVVLALLCFAGALTSSVAHGQEPPSTVITAPHIIPRPNSGQAPMDAGDRGGALQLLILGALVLGIGAAGAHVVRESRRARSESSRAGG